MHAILPGLLGGTTTFAVYPFQGKQNLLSKLENRLRGYAGWIPEAWRILVVVDRDSNNCLDLKKTLVTAAQSVKLRTRSSARQDWNVLFGIAIEELEAWYFGEWNAVCKAYPRVNRNAVRSSRFRNCDQIAGGTWEAFEQVLQRAGYFTGGLRKIEAARRIGKYFNGASCSSPSYKYVESAIKEAVF